MGKNPCHAAGGGSFGLFSSISRDSCLKNDCFKIILRSR